jgi:GNAT superfamily N-acetyltransferase
MCSDLRTPFKNWCATMIEIRTFEGDAEELARFTNSVWRRSYEGRMMVPLWSSRFLHRDLLPGDGTTRDYLVAAYDGAKLVGLHPARPIQVRLHAEEFPASWGSFLSVDPDYRGQRIAQQMQDELMRRHRDRGARASFGFVYLRSSHALGPKFWFNQPEETVLVRKLGLWMRALDHATAARFELHRLEAWGSRFTALWQRPPEPPSDSTGIRPYRPDDLPECMELVRRAGERADLAYLWDQPALESQLCWPGLSQTIVMEHGGEPAGLVNYTLWEVLGRVPCVLAVIDLLALGDLPRRDRRRLLTAAMYQMKTDGAAASVMLRGSWYGGWDLWAAGFFPMVSEYHYLGTWAQGSPSFKKVRRLHVLWR